MDTPLSSRWLLLIGVGAFFLGCTPTPAPTAAHPGMPQTALAYSPPDLIPTQTSLPLTRTPGPAECLDLGCPLNRLDTPSAATRAAMPILQDIAHPYFAFPGGEQVFRVAVSPDGGNLAVSTGTGIWIYDIPSQALVWKIGFKFDSKIVIFPIAWSPDGNLLAAGLPDGNIEVWDVAKRRQISRMESQNTSVTSLSWAHDGRRLASTNMTGSWDKGVINVWDSVTWERLWSFALKGTSFAWNMDFSPDNSSLALTTANFPPDGLQIWDLRTGQRHNLGSYPGQGRERNELQEIEWFAASPIQRPAAGGCAGFFGVRWSPEGSNLATVDNCFALFTLWDFGSGQKKYTLDGPSWMAIWSPGGKYLAMDENGTSSGYNLRVVLAGSGQGIQYLSCPMRDIPEYKGVNSGDMVWSPVTGAIYAVDTKGEMCIWQMSR